MQHSRKMQEPRYHDRYLPSHYGLLQDDWEKTVKFGFSDVLLEAGMNTTDSVTKVMNGKNYSRALNCHETLTETILLNKFTEEHELSKNLKLLAEGFLHNVNTDSLKLSVGQPYVEDFVRQFNDFIHSTELGKTAKF